MAVQIIHNEDGAVLYCSTDMQAFGPVLEDEQAAIDFCDWFTDGSAISAAIGSDKVRGIPELDGRHENDPRSYSPADLMELYGVWLNQREEVQT